MKNSREKNTSLKQERQLKEILKTLIYVKESKDLIKVIMEKVAEIFPLDDVGLFVIREDGWHRDFAVDYYNYDSISKNIRDAGISGFLPPDEALNSLMKETKIVDFKQLLEKFPNHPHFPFLWEGGLREFISGPMYFRGEPFGVFILWSKKEGRFSHEDIPFFNEIKEYISISLKHIVERENLEKEKNFKETLLTITEAIASINSSKELYKTIFERIKPVFPYDELGLFVLDDSGDFHYELIDQEVQEITISQAKIEENLGTHTKYKHVGTTAEWLMAKSVCMISMEELNKRTEHPHLKYMLEAGLKQMISAPLLNGGKSFGLLCFSSLVEDFYAENDLILFKNIAEQISVAVSNILANEKVLSEKNFKEKLLNISTAVSTITNRKQLFKVIFDDLKTLLDFDNAGLFYIDNEKDEFYEVLEEDVTDDIQDELARNNLLGPFQYSGAHKQALIYVDEVSLLDVEEQSKIYPNPQWEIMMNLGLKKMLVSPLNLGREKIGLICFNTKEENLYSEGDFRLVSAIAEQMSIALGNVMTNEQLLQEKEFNEALLSLTESLSSMRTTKGLYENIFTKVKPLLPFEEMAIMVLDDTRQFNYELTSDSLSIHKYVPNIAEERFGKPVVFPHKGSITKWFKENGPVSISIKEVDKLAPEIINQYLLEEGFHHIIGGPLKSEGEAFGIICFFSKQKNFYTDEHIPLFKAISEQLGLAVSNILTSEEIIRKNQLQELELQLSNQILDVEDYNIFFGGFLQCLSKLIPFTYVTINIEGKEVGTYRFEWLTSKEYRSLDTETLLNITNLPQKELNRLETKMLHHKMGSQGFINDLDDIKVSFKELLTALPLRAMIKKKYEVNKGDMEITIALFHKFPSKYLPRHTEILNALESTLTLSFQHMLASKEIKELSEQLQLEKNYLETAVKEAYNFNEMVGESDTMKGVFKKITEVSQVDATVLLLGETGTGKELIARAIHENSDRHDKVLIKVNCAAIPAQIVESELFGHEKGAFTGAVQRRIGKFELAHKGTIFLDEIGEMPLELQTKLLRVLQERELERLGSNETIKLDFRVIAATNRNLEEEVSNGKFRADLFYRLNAFPIMVPPLSQREDDVILIADFFSRQTSERFGLPFKGFTQNTLSRLKNYSWPGNVRELQNIIEQSIISQQGHVLEIYPGRSNILSFEKATQPNGIINEDLINDENFDMNVIKNEKDKVERAYLLKVLEDTKWRVSGKNGAALKLGIAPSTLESRMRKLNITRS
ncbi:sigma 54-interacting transcriptional regulator [uncultured Croceitalea sp.]|uniref:sigma-54-dependent Fis family transcriptional regulator n=1 Tax=uncultured Croceitalea sp. TaxID=1798908 RepID=UPI003305A930